MYIRRKVFSVAYDEATGEEKLFSTTEIMSEEAYIEKLYAEAEKPTHKKIRGGSNARIWMDKHLRTKKDREAIIEAYDQEGERNSHKLGKQSAKYAGAAGAAMSGIGSAVALNQLEKKSGRGAAEFLKGVGTNKKIVKAALKNPKLAKTALIAGAAGVEGGLAAGGGYVGTRLGRAIGKKIEDASETESHSAQKIADENKVASGKMSRDEFAQKYGRNLKPSNRREFEKK